MLWLFSGGLLLLSFFLLQVQVGGPLVQILPLLASVVAVFNFVGGRRGKKVVVNDVLLQPRRKDTRWRV